MYMYMCQQCANSLTLIGQTVVMVVASPSVLARSFTGEWRVAGWSSMYQVVRRILVMFSLSKGSFIDSDVCRKQNCCLSQTFMSNISCTGQAIYMYSIGLSGALPTLIPIIELFYSVYYLIIQYSCGLTLRMRSVHQWSIQGPMTNQRRQWLGSRTSNRSIVNTSVR